MPSDNKSLRSCLRNPNVRAAHPDVKAVHFNAQRRVRPIPRLNRNPDPFPQDTVPCDEVIQHRPGGKPGFLKPGSKIPQWLGLAALPGHCIEFPTRHLSTKKVLYVDVCGREELVHVIFHPLYYISAMPFLPRAWAEPEVPAASSEVVAQTADHDVHHHARLTNAAAERRVVTHAFLECWLIETILAGKFGEGLRRRCIHGRWDAEIRRAVMKEIEIVGTKRLIRQLESRNVIQPSLRRFPPQLRAVLAKAPSSQPSMSSGPPPTAIPPFSLAGGTIKEKARVVPGPVVRHTYRDDELRPIMARRNTKASLDALNKAETLREELEDDMYSSSKLPFHWIAGTNQVLVGIALRTIPSDIGGEQRADAAAAAASALDTVSSSLNTSSAPTATSTQPAPLYTSAPTAAVATHSHSGTNQGFDGLSLEKLRNRLADAEAVAAQTAESMAELDEDIERAELLLEIIEDDDALVLAMENEDMRKANREYMKAGRAAVQTQRPATVDTAYPSTSTSTLPPSTSTASPLSTLPCPLPPALIPLHPHPWRRGCDVPPPAPSALAENPQSAAQPTSSDRCRPLRRQHVCRQPQSEQDDVFPCPGTRLSERERLEIEHRLETEYMQRRQSAPRAPASASHSYSVSPKRKRDDQDEEKEAGPVAKRARSETPPPADPMPTTTKPTPSLEHTNDSAAEASQVAYASEQTTDAGSATNRTPSSSPPTGAGPVPGSPTPSLKRKRFEDDEQEASGGQPAGASSTPPRSPSSGEGGSPTKRMRASGWFTIA